MLQFEYIKNLTQDTSHNISPYYVENPFIINEPNEDIYQYYCKDYRAWDKKSQTPLGQYEDMSWDNLDHHLTIKEVVQVGAKHFPQIGAIGFYKNKYTNTTNVLAPVHIEDVKYEPPVLSALFENNLIYLTITPPEDITYSCYRVVMRSGMWAQEYIVYDTSIPLPMPNVRGAYEMYAIGYNENTGVRSTESNYISFVNSIGKENWQPEPLIAPTSLADLTDVNLAALLNAQVLRYNSTTGKWENGDVPTPTPGASSLADLTDVKLTNVEDSDILQFSEASSKWENTINPNSSPPMLFANNCVSTTGTTLTGTLNTEPGQLVLVAVVHRSALTIPEGWEIIFTGADIESTSFVQQLTVCYKYATSVQESFTATQEFSGRLYINLHSFRYANKPFIIGDPIIGETGPINIGKNRDSSTILYAAHTSVMLTGATQWTLNPDALTQMGVATEPRLVTLLDNRIATNYTLYNGVDNPAKLIQIGLSNTVITGCSIDLNVSELWLNQGETYQLQPTVTPADAAIIYSSADPTIATVSDTGLITALTGGKITITATASDGHTIVSDTCTLRTSVFDVTTYDYAAYMRMDSQVLSTLDRVPNGATTYATVTNRTASCPVTAGKTYRIQFTMNTRFRGGTLATPSTTTKLSDWYVHPEDTNGTTPVNDTRSLDITVSDGMTALYLFYWTSTGAITDHMQVKNTIRVYEL